jgi:DNA repair exonuclease SbcCD nuclease subunit
LPTEMLREPVLSLDGLVTAGFGITALGHIHKAQVLYDAPPVFYTGTPLITNWGETEDEHGVWIFDTTGALRFVQLPDRDFITLDFDLTDWGDTPEWETLIPTDEYEGANVRVRYRCDEEMARRIDEAAIRRYLVGEGALKVVFRPTIERKARARVEAMDESLDENAAFDLWLSSQNGSVSVDPDALRVLHGEFLERAR